MWSKHSRFTLIEAIVSRDRRQVQHRLGLEITAIVHGREAALQAQEDSWSAFQHSQHSASLPDGVSTFGVPTFTVAARNVDGGIVLAQLLKRAQVAPSVGVARKLLQQGGVRLNGAKEGQSYYLLSIADFQEVKGELTVLVLHGRGRILKVMLSN